MTGVLGKTPLAEFLIQAYDRGLEGTLLLQTADRQKSAIWFVRGAPAKARLFNQTHTLSEVVVELGLVSADRAQLTQNKAEQEQRLHGSVMVEHGLLDQTGIFVALREQLTRQVLSLCQLPETTGFGVYHENLLEDWGHQGQWRVKPLRLIWRALADHLSARRRESWLAQLKDTHLRLRPESPVSRYGLTKAEEAVVDMIRVRSGPLSQLLDCGVGTPTVVGKVVCALLLTRQLDVGFKDDPVGLHEPAESPQSLLPPRSSPSRSAPSRSAPSRSAPTNTVPSNWTPSPGTPSPWTPAQAAPLRSTPARSPTSSTPQRSTTSPAPHGSPARHVTPAPQSFITSLEAPILEAPRTQPTAPLTSDQLAFVDEVQKYQDHPPKNYYEILGVPSDASSAQVRTVFFQLARRWHPDKLPAALQHLRPVVTRAFAAMGEAHQTLMDDAKRAEYHRGLSMVPEDEQEQVATILRAASAHQRAEILFKKKSYREALADAKIAYDIDATQPDHVTLYAWLHSVVYPDLDPHPQIAMMSHILETNPDHVRTLWYRGQLYKKLNLTNKAMSDFKHILGIKPSHVEAARELRVHSMRRQTDPKNPPSSQRSGGLFGSFRKKS